MVARTRLCVTFIRTLPVLFPHRTVIMSPYNNLCRLSNEIAADSLSGTKCKTRRSSSLNPKFLCGDRISMKSFVGGHSQSFQLDVLQVGEYVGVEYLQMYSHIKYSLLAYTNDTVDYRPTSCWRVHDKKLEKCARKQFCHVRSQEAARESPNSFS